MIKTLLILILIVAVSFLLLGVRLLLGKQFIHTHIEGNKAMNDQGITCYRDMEKKERCHNRFAVSEKSK